MFSGRNKEKEKIMTRLARDRSERHFLYFIMVLIICISIFVWYDIPKLLLLAELSFIFGLLCFRGLCLSGRPEGDIDVIRQVIKDK